MSPVRDHGGLGAAAGVDSGSQLGGVRVVKLYVMLLLYIHMGRLCSWIGVGSNSSNSSNA